MRELYEEGLAPHLGLDLCANLPRGGREALTEADAGWEMRDGGNRGRAPLTLFVSLGLTWSGEAGT